jgi:RNA polymerase sigma-70 factor (ECF subfamily)
VSEIAATDTATHDLELYRGELTGYCYRMLGSAHDADDAVQEAMVRAWQAFDRFEGRSAVRSWLYRIATNVCLDMLRSRKRRALPMDLSAPVPSSTEPVATLPESAWIEPMPGDGPLPPDTDPAGRVVLQDSIRLAFISALQNLPPRQRAVLILREVLCWQAAEVAALLDTTVVSVNSALQRARTTMAASDQSEDRPPPPLEDADRELLARYVDAFQRYDIDRLVALLHEDASISMPPYEMWIRGRDELRGWYTGWGSGCDGSRMIPVTANASPAFAQYKPSGDGTRLVPWCIQVPELSDGRIMHIHHFIDTDGRLFKRFGLPPYLDREDAEIS